MKVKAYSTTFQMHKMCGLFLGLDTMNLADYGKFDFLSYISGRDELLSYCGRSDIRGLITQHAATGVIPAWLAEEYEDWSSFVRNLNASCNSDAVSGGHWDGCLKAGCNICFVHDSIRLQKLLDDDGVAEDVVLDDARVLDNLRFQANDTICAVQFIPVWPKDIVWSNTTDYNGARFPPIPWYLVANRDMRYLWIVVSMLACIPLFLRATVNSVNVTSNWQGWMLS
jgi:hypothetical protein